MNINKYQELEFPNIRTQKIRCVFSRYAKQWFVEGLLYSTFVALIWTNEEPSKFNTLLVSWSAYAAVAIVLMKATRSGTIINPTKWIRMYFIQSLLLLVVCNFIWLKGSVPRADGDYFDPIRFDYYSVILADSGMDPAEVTFQNYTGTIWYAGFIYWVFGVSKFYVTLFNGALSFITLVLFASIMRQIEGNPQRWQWLRFGMILPDFLFHFANVSKEPLCAFIVALGIWVIAKNMAKGRILPTLVSLAPVLVLGLAVRAAAAVLVVFVAFIWFWKSGGRKRKIGALIIACTILLMGQPITDYVLQKTGASQLNWRHLLSILTDPSSRIREDLYYAPDSWCAIIESLPFCLVPVVAPIKGIFMMIAPMPLWRLHFDKILGNIINSNYVSPELEQLFPKITSWLFVISIPLLSSAFFDTYRSNRRLWITFPLTFALVIALMGFSVYGIIETRYRPMILPFWLSVCGIGYYYGRPKRYICITIVIAVLGAVIYLIYKI
jgi:hypothetical protein